MTKQFKLEYVKELNKYLDNWLEENNFEYLSTAFDMDFWYDRFNDVIHYSILSTDSHDRLYINFCKELEPRLVQADNFVLSFFHEIGHYMTDDDCSDEQWENYFALTEELSQEDNPSDDCFIRYYTHPVELSATKWALNYLIQNSEKVANFFSKFKILLKSILEKNGFDVDELLAE